MSEPIKAGDLVQIIKPWPCCGSVRSLGQIFRVAKISGGRLGHRLAGCPGTAACTSALDATDGLWTEIGMLKRIPPLAELEGEEHDEEITA